MFKNIVSKLLIVAGGLILIWCSAAVTMVLWPVPKFAHPFPAFTPNRAQAAAPVTPPHLGETVQFHMRDGAVLRGREFGSSGLVTIPLPSRRHEQRRLISGDLQPASHFDRRQGNRSRSARPQKVRWNPRRHSCHRAI
jgi:hypothetical protein